MPTSYSNEDRRTHLNELSNSLKAMALHLEQTGRFPEMLDIYTSLQGDVKTLLATSFTQTDLSKLSRAIPDIYDRHKEWVPPLEETDQGAQEPKWFQELETYLNPVLNSAQRLREIGYY